MYENGIDVVYEQAVGNGDGTWRWDCHRRVTLPGWCAGDVPMALALHFMGTRDYVGDFRVTDWQPHVDDEPLADEDDDRPDPAELLTRWLHDGDDRTGRMLLSALALDPARVYEAVRPR